MTELRSTSRQRTFLKGVLSFQNGAASADALVRNVSDSGVLIELAYPSAPDAFDLLIPVQDVRVSARVVWRKGCRIGAAFQLYPEKPAPRPAIRDEGY